MAGSIFMPEMTNLQVREYLEGGGRTVIVPVGSTEDHGDHGPLWTDVYIPLEVAKRAAPELEAIVGPPIPFGIAHDHRGAHGLIHVRMDTWFSERTLHDAGAVRVAVDRLRREGFAYDQDGAVFFRSTLFGDDKDRVLVRSNGAPTYVGVDCAYLLNKAERGFDRLIYILGADHHGWMTRMQGAAKALRIEASFEVVLYQLVSLLRGGEPVRMSKRAGEAITLDELIDEVGADPARFALLSRSNDSTIDFDIEVVTRQSMDNPVFYVQYAHARVASLLRVAAEQGVELQPIGDVDLSLLATDSELDLMRTLAELPEVIATAADSLAPHRLTRYAEEVAAAFHRFYTECRVVTEDAPLTQARLRLSQAAKQVIAAALGLIGVSAPESMARLGDGEEASGADGR